LNDDAPVEDDPTFKSWDEEDYDNGVVMEFSGS